MKNTNQKKTICKLANKLIALAARHRVDMVFTGEGLGLGGPDGIKEVEALVRHLGTNDNGIRALALIRDLLSTGALGIADLGEIIPFRNGFGVNLSATAHSRVKRGLQTGEIAPDEHLVVID
jgi:hypothetical protein